MFAAIDVGNTTAKVALVSSESKRNIYTFPSCDDSYMSIRNLVTNNPLSKAVVCTVNPPFSTQLEHILKEADIPVFYVDYTNIPLKNKYNPPSGVGSDRLVTSYAVLKRFDADAVIIDMGSAITFEVVTRDGEYLGGLIFPGIQLLRKSLNDHTAFLPLVEVKAGRYPAVASTTEEAVAGGIFKGVNALIDRIVEDIQISFKMALTVCVTGGDAEIFRDSFPPEWEIVPDIIIDGLTLLEKELSFD